MKKLKERVYEFNRKRMAEGAKATDLDIIIAEIMKLPPGQLKKVLTDPVIAVLEKYGYSEG